MTLNENLATQFDVAMQLQSAVMDHFGVYWGQEVAAFAQSAGVWWSTVDYHIATERPTIIKHDPQQRVHCDDGPAIAYRDGWEVYAWHGVNVPKDMITSDWSVSRIYREPNVEVRRCAVEKMGWDRFIKEGNLVQSGATVPDPANPGHVLSLYKVPMAIVETNTHVLLCDNATPERDGTRRRFGLLVPGTITDPLAAAAWTFGLPAEHYLQMTHAY